MRRVLGFSIGTVLGGLVGAILALLFAPSSGKELRDQINDLNFPTAIPDELLSKPDDKEFNKVIVQTIREFDAFLLTELTRFRENEHYDKSISIRKTEAGNEIKGKLTDEVRTRLDRLTNAQNPTTIAEVRTWLSAVKEVIEAEKERLAMMVPRYPALNPSDLPTVEPKIVDVPPCQKQLMPIDWWVKLVGLSEELRSWERECNEQAAVENTKNREWERKKSLDKARKDLDYAIEEAKKKLLSLLGEVVDYRLREILEGVFHEQNQLDQSARRQGRKTLGEELDRIAVELRTHSQKLLDQYKNCCDLNIPPESMKIVFQQGDVKNDAQVLLDQLADTQAQGYNDPVNLLLKDDKGIIASMSVLLNYRPDGPSDESQVGDKLAERCMSLSMDLIKGFDIAERQLADTVSMYQFIEGHSRHHLQLTGNPPSLAMAHKPCLIAGYGNHLVQLKDNLQKGGGN